MYYQKNSWVNLDDGIYNGHGENNTTSSPTVAPGASKTSVGQRNTEVVTLDLSVDDKWYRIYYYPIIDNMNTTNTEKDIFINPKIILIIC